LSVVKRCVKKRTRQSYSFIKTLQRVKIVLTYPGSCRTLLYFEEKSVKDLYDCYEVVLDDYVTVYNWLGHVLFEYEINEPLKFQKHFLASLWEVECLLTKIRAFIEYLVSEWAYMKWGSNAFKSFMSVILLRTYIVYFSDNTKRLLFSYFQINYKWILLFNFMIIF